MKVSSQDVEKACTLGGEFIIPANVRRAIEACVSRPIDDVTEEYNNLLQTYRNYRQVMAPNQVVYQGTLTLDAYTTYYLPRNIVIPWIGLRDLFRHPQFQSLPTELKILDLGSGTGAVPIGLLHLFGQKPFSAANMSIVAVDGSKEALERQMKLINLAGFPRAQVSQMVANLGQQQTWASLVEERGPYDLVFVANCLTELDPESVNALLPLFSRILTANGAVIIAEAQRDYVKARIVELAKNADSSGLFVYYPCPIMRCNRNGRCWVWRDHHYQFPDLSIGGHPLPELARERLTLSWLFLTKQPISLYDVLRKEDGSLVWGPIARTVGGLEMCDGTNLVAFEPDDNISQVYARGNIVGLTQAGSLMGSVDLQ